MYNEAKEKQKKIGGYDDHGDEDKLAVNLYEIRMCRGHVIETNDHSRKILRNDIFHARSFRRRIRFAYK